MLHELVKLPTDTTYRLYTFLGIALIGLAPTGAYFTQASIDELDSQRRKDEAAASAALNEWALRQQAIVNAQAAFVEHQEQLQEMNAKPDRTPQMQTAIDDLYARLKQDYAQINKDIDDNRTRDQAVVLKNELLKALIEEQMKKNGRSLWAFLGCGLLGVVGFGLTGFGLWKWHSAERKASGEVPSSPSKRGSVKPPKKVGGGKKKKGSR